MDGSANDIEYDKIEILVARVRAIEGVDLYLSYRDVICSNVVAPKKLYTWIHKVYWNLMSFHLSQTLL